MVDVDEQIAFVRACLDRVEQVALAASRRDGDGFTPTGEHWHWVEPIHDQPLVLDPMLDEYVNNGIRAALRSVEEYPTSPFTLPHFVVSYAEETRTTDAMHIALHDPAYVLADVAAKRRIVRLCENALAAVRAGSISERNRTQDEAAVDVLGEAVSALAQTYAGWPGWREEWRA